MLTKEQKEKVRAAYDNDVWHGNKRMTDYCTNKVAVLAEFPNGDFIPIDKQTIETRFCFGESGYDYDDAQESAHVARTSEQYFKRENMREFIRWNDSINEQYEMFWDVPHLPNNVMVIWERHYSGQPETSHLKAIGFERASWLLDSMGGSAYVRELPGKKLEIRGLPCHIVTKEELDIIREAYLQAANEHSKKIDTYLKRYGLSKVHAWTYWRDA